MTMQQISDARFYMFSALGFTFAAILAGSILSACGMSEAQVISTVVTIMGFAGLAITQYRTAAQAAAIGQSAAQAATHAALDSAEALSKITEGITERLVELAEVAKATHVLVNNQRDVLLEEHAALWKRLADFTGTAADRQSAGLAKIAAGIHGEVSST